MDKQSIIQTLKSLRDMSRDLYEQEDDVYKEDSIHKEDAEALSAAICILQKEESRKFNRSLLDKMLEEIITEYFSDETIEYGYGMWEVIHAVRARYKDEIETLPA